MRKDYGKISCRGFDSDEKIEIYMVKHWMTYVKTFIATLFLLSIVGGITLFLNFVLPELKLWIYTFAHITITFICLWVFIQWYEDAMDIVVISNKRFFYQMQMSFLRKESVSIPLSQIQDVQARQEGFSQHVFLYGDIIIQTSSERGSFHLTYIRKPHSKSTLVLSIAHKFREMNG
jgi:hypothetical protein